MRALLLLLCLTLPAQAANPPAVTVRIGWLRGTNDITLLKARSTLERALAPLGATVEWDGPFPASAPAVEAINAGAIDITVGSSTSAVASLAAGAPIVIFAYQRLSPDGEAILVHRQAPIQTLADLAGHTVAVNRGGTGEYLLLTALQRAGIDPAAVKRVYLSPPDAVAAFAAGAVDAIAAWDPFLTIALTRDDARILANGAQIGSENAIVMLARTGFATDHPALLQALYDALLADNRWEIAHKDAAGLLWADALHLPATDAQGLGQRGAVPTGPVGPAQAAQIGHIAAWYAAAGIIPAAPSLAGATLDLAPSQ